MRIRWSGVAKGVAVMVVLLLAVPALPGLVRPPQPQPLEADVGLPRNLPRAEPAPMKPRVERPDKPDKGPKTRQIRSRTRTGAAAVDVIGSKPGPRASRPEIVSGSPPPVPAPARTQAPEPAPAEPAFVPASPAPAPAPSPPPVSDGSEEFAPR